MTCFFEKFKEGTRGIDGKVIHQGEYGSIARDQWALRIGREVDKILIVRVAQSPRAWGGDVVEQHGLFAESNEEVIDASRDSREQVGTVQYGLKLTDQLGGDHEFECPLSVKLHQSSWRTRGPSHR